MKKDASNIDKISDIDLWKQYKFKAGKGRAVYEDVRAEITEIIRRFGCHVEATIKELQR